MNDSGLYPMIKPDASGTSLVSQAGAVMLVEAVRTSRVDQGLSRALVWWRKPLAHHDPGKIVTDLALSLALGGDCLADVAILRGQSAVFGPVASDPTVSRLVDTLAADADRVLQVIDGARAAARARVWALAGEHAPDHGADRFRPRIVDVDATLITAHSDKEHAAPTFKKGYGFHPLLSFVDHGQNGTGEPLMVLLRKGNAGSNTAADHIAVLKAAFAQLPGHRPRARPGRTVLVRADAAGATHELLGWLERQRVQYSVGFTLPDEFADKIRLLDQTEAWQPAYDGDRQIRDGAFVAEATGLLELRCWPAGMRVIVRKERPHPGAQLRITDIDGNRITAFATNTPPSGPGMQLADLELRHRRRARCEDRIRLAKDTGLTNLPLHDFNQNRIWLALVALACDITAWMQLLAFTGEHPHPARRWEPKRLRLRLFSIAGRIADHARRRVLHLDRHAPWAPLVINAVTALRALAQPG